MYRCYQRIKITESEVLSFPCCISTSRNYVTIFQVCVRNALTKTRSEQTNRKRVSRGRIVYGEETTSVSAGANRRIIFYSGVSLCHMHICIFIVTTFVLMTTFAANNRRRDPPIFFSSNHYFRAIIALVQWQEKIVCVTKFFDR